MSKLIFLNKNHEYNKVKNHVVNENDINIDEETDKQYYDFENTFYKNILKNNFAYKTNSLRNKIISIINKLFILENKVPFIDFINSIYEDGLSYKCNVEFADGDNLNDLHINEFYYDMKILVKDYYRNFEYYARFQIDEKENTSIVILKKELTKNTKNILNFNKKKAEYKSLKKQDKIDGTDIKIIILNTNVSVPDNYEINNKISTCLGTVYKFDIIKGWKLGFKQLIENNMYWLFPMKVFDLRKRLCEIDSEFLINDEIQRFFKEMDLYLNKLQGKQLISTKDKNTLNYLSNELLKCIMK